MWAKLSDMSLVELILTGIIYSAIRLRVSRNIAAFINFGSLKDANSKTTLASKSTLTAILTFWLIGSESIFSVKDDCSDVKLSVSSKIQYKMTG